MAGSPASADGALPSGGKYVAGQGTINGTGNGLTITQASKNGIINWQGFSIGTGNSVQFNNGSGATLNRVVGADISKINGSLSATGSVYLVNPQGVVIGPGGKVVTNGSFVVSTRDVSNSAFMSGGPFAASGSSNGSVVNAGAITSNNGDAILVGRSVTNKGTISAPNGTAALAAGDNILLRPVGGDPRIAISGGTGDVTNTGAIKAAQAQLSAAGGNVYALAGNNGVGISATGTKTVNGHVWLTAGGTTEVSGAISATNADGSGGNVTVRGADIGVSGQINASATAAGQAGGNVSVIATGTTTVSGSVKAEGGQGGKGGFIETSGEHLHVANSAQISTAAQGGVSGTWLIDPNDFTIAASGGDISGTTLSGELATTDVTIQSSSGATAGNGDIFVNDAVSWSSSHALTLSAARNIDINATISITGAGALDLETGTGGSGDYSFGLTSTGFTGHVDFGTTNNGASLTINGTPYTILYSLSDLAGINTNAGLSGNYALAGNLDDANVAWTPLGTNGAGVLLNGGQGFTGTFTGLGHTISNINVNTGGAQLAGLFGYAANAGTLRDIGIVGGSVTGAGTVGGLAGAANNVLNAFSTATVSGTVSSGSSDGGLAGLTEGTVSNVFATGTVTSANPDVGGLIGSAAGPVSNAFATGTVTSTNSGGNAGGLIGFNAGGITNAYATGFVSASGTTAYAGGLVGFNIGDLNEVYSIGQVVVNGNANGAGGSIGQNFAGTFTDAYYDTQYSGALNAVGTNIAATAPAGVPTSALQGTLPGSFSSTVWGTGAGLYPYLKNFYPNGVQAITGTAFTGSLALATSHQSYTVGAYVDGTAVYPGATLGSRGQYYLVLPGGTLTGSQHLLTVLQGTGGNDYITGASGNVSADLHTGTLSMTSSAASVSAMLSGIATAEGSNSSSDFDYSGGSFHNSATAEFISSSATGFTVDTLPSGTGGISIKTTAGDISITAPVTLSGGAPLTLDSYKSIDVDATLSITGGSAVSLTTNDGGSGGDYGFGLTSTGFTGSLDFGTTNNGASLTINGGAYTLLYSMSDLAGINTDSGLQLQKYALATNLDDANAAWTPLGTNGAGALKNGGAGFSGNFTGLGHTVANLNVDTGSHDYAGLFGFAIGTIRDVGVVGGTVNGGSYVGGLIGLSNNPLSNVFSSAAVTATGDGVGGLAGVVGGVNNGFATGSVSGGDNVGGLAGVLAGTNNNIYATGSVNGSTSVGGLAGFVSASSVSISNAYATGAVQGSDKVGGLVGNLFSTNLSNVYATGAVTGSSNVGGLIGFNDHGTISNGYWDTQTSGTSTGIGGGPSSATGLTTRQLQGLDTISGSLFSLSGNLGDSTGTTWGGGAGGLYPYLKTFFPSTPQAITGTAYNAGGGTVLAGSGVTALVNGNTIGTASTGANGYYYVLAPSGTITSGAAVLAYENIANGGFRVDSATAAGNISGFDVWGATLIAPTTASNYSTASASRLQFQDVSLISTAVGSNSTAASLLSALTNYGYIASGDFTIDQPLTLSNGLYVKSTGSITVANALTLPSSNGLALDAADTLTINATVSVTGAGRVELATGLDTTTASGFSIAKLSFGTGDSIDYGATNNGGSLSINGAAYTLLYSMTDVAAINGDGTNDSTTNTALSANYALATALDASGTSGWQPLGTDAGSAVLNSGSGFSGTFEGLNHAISNLNVDLGVAGGANNAGLFGASSGTLRDVTLTGGSARGSASVGLLAGWSNGVVENVSGSGSVTAVTQGGGLIGFADGAVINASSSGSVTSFGPGGGLIGESGAVVLNDSSSATVTGEIIPGSSSSGNPGPLGGLIGMVDGGSVTFSHATGDVTAADGDYMGGLLGSTNVGVTVSNTYATGNVTVTNIVNGGVSIGGLIGDSFDAVTDSYATGNVTGVKFAGGLIGSAEATSSLARSYATGSVTGDANSTTLGGLIGSDNGISVNDAYASGAVTGGDHIGGLFGTTTSTVNNVFSTGLVQLAPGASSVFVGGLAGEADGTITNGYWNTETSGQSTGLGIDGSGTSTTTGLKTADMQGGIASSFSSSIWAAGSGLYPYFQWRYASTPEAITGKAYAPGGGVAAAGSTVTTLLNGNSLGTATAGANGYYYTLLDPGTITAGAAVLTSSDGANAGARVDTAAGGSISNFDVWGSTLIAPTTASTYSNASATSLQSQNTLLISNAVGSNATASTLVSGLTNYGYIASGDFTIDPTQTLSNGLYVKSGGNITVPNALVLPGSNGLTLDASNGAITINAPISVTGAGRVELNASFQPIACGCTTALALSFGSNGKVDYGTTNNGGSLSINGDAYTLLYTMSDVAAVNGDGTNDATTDTALQGNYALATAINATGVSGWVPLGVDSTGAPLNSSFGFEGKFEGLGNSVSNLTVASVGGLGGFFGPVTGTVRDLSLSSATVIGSGSIGVLAAQTLGAVIDNVTVSGTINGADDGLGLGGVGGLIGFNAGYIENAHAAVAVDGTDSLATGGLVGLNFGVVDNSGATGSVTGTTNSASFAGIGGLVGTNTGEINLSAATGSVTGGTRMPVGGLVGSNFTIGPDSAVISDSFATGAVQGGTGAPAGGLVGLNDGGLIYQTYATGSVTAGDSGAAVGGLVGANGSGGQIAQSFATGSATGGTGALAGGLVGDNVGDILESYATGAAQAGGSDGISPSLAGGLVGENEIGATIKGSYSTGIATVSDPSGSAGGFIGNNDSTTPADIDLNYFDIATSGTTVGVGSGNAVNGVTGQTTSQLQSALPAGFSSTDWGIVSGQSYPYFLWRFPTAPDVVSGTVFTAQGGSAVAGQTVNAVVGGAVAGTTSSGANGYYNVLLDSGTLTSTGVFAFYLGSSSGGGTFADGVSGAATGLDIYNNLRIVTPDASLSTTNANFVTTVGTLFGAGVASISDFLNLPGINSDLQIEASNSFTLDQTINAPQTVTIETAGDLTIASGSTVNGTGAGRAVVLSATNDFVNNEGSGAIGITGGGSWLVYSGAPAGDTFNSLDSSNTAVWNANIGTLVPGSVTQTGDRYVFALQPTVTLTPTNDSKTYGDTLDISGDYAVSGLQGGVTGAYRADTAATAFSGAPVVSSAGTSATAQVSGSPYDITLSSGTLTGLNGYVAAISNATPGQLTVNQKALTITANDASKTYGDTFTFAGTEFTTSGLVNTDAVSSVSLSSTGAAGNAIVAGSPYAITASAASGSGLGNYAITYVGGALTVGKRAITVTADAQSRTYGDANPTFTFTTSNLGAGTAVLGSLATSATASSDVGSYAIIQGSVTNANNSNYDITYVGTNLAIGTRAITVTADTLSRTYGDANPTLTFTTSNLGAGAAVQGSLTTSATASSDIGSYTITQGTVTNANNSNYDITYVGANLAVDVRPITVTADAQLRTYGDANPTLTFTTSNLGAGAAVQGSLATSATTASDIGGYAITQGTVTNANNSNYDITYVGANLTVGARPITVTADDLNRLYGDNNPTLTETVTAGNLVNGDTLSGSLSTSATATSDVGGYAITQGTLAATPNYALSFVPGTLTISQRPITVTADGQSRTYGDANPTLPFTTSNLGAGTAVLGSLATSATASSDVGTYAITQGTVTNANNGNYDIAYVGDNLTVTLRAITVTADALSRAYGDANPTLTFTTSSLGAGTAVQGSLATSATASSDVGAYAITQGSVTNANNSNYDITYVGDNLTVGTRAITVTADSLSRTYGDANPTLTFTTSGLGAGTAVQGSLATSAIASSDVGTYAITQGSVTNANNSNYDITYVGANLTVGTRAITVTADALSRAYGDANPTLTFTTSNLGAGTAVQGSLATSATAASDVGAYAITQGSVTNANNSNYDITYVGANLTVGTRAITVTADDLSRLYGDNNPALTETVTTGNLVNGDTLSGSLSTNATATSNVGGYAVTQGTLAASPNYALTFIPGTLMINQRPITVTADAQSRTYGDANPALTFTTSSLGAGTAVQGSLATSATTASGVGSYAITQGTVTNANNSNYDITYVGANLTIGTRAIAVTADDLSRLYGDNNPALTETVTTGNLVNGDTLSGSLSTSATATSNVGGYAITLGTLAASPNYALSFVPGTLTINQRPITVTADAQSRIYGDANPTFTFTTSNLGAGTAVQGSLATSATTASGVGSYAVTQGTVTNANNSNYDITYAGANLTIGTRAITVTADDLSRLYGDNNPALTETVTAGNLVNGDTLSGSLTTGATVTSSVGGYAITQGTLAASANYALTFVPGTLTINQRPITVTADSQSRIYGDSNPTLTDTISSGNLVNGDSLSGSLTTGATATSNVGGYAITQGTLATSANYVLTFVPGTLTIDQRPITVTADAQSRTYGDSNPTLTDTITSGNLVNGDSLSGSLTTGATATSNVGGYAITQGTLAASPNYALTFAPGTLTISQRSITVTADAQSRTYGDGNPTLTDTITSGNLVNGDSLSGGLTTGATAISNVGGYAITQGTLAASPNYVLAFVPGTLTITARPITITADNLSRVYGAANPALTYGVGGKGLVNSDTLSGGLTTGATSSSNVGSYAVDQGTLAASSNYTVTFVPGTLTVTPATLTASLTGTVGKTYDGTTTATLAAGNYALSGVIGSDTVALNSPTTGAYDSKTVGTSKTVTVVGLVLTGASAGNYKLSSSTVSGIVGVINPAALTIDANDISAFALLLAQPTATYTGFVNGETSSLVTGLQFALLPVTGNSLQYDIVPFGAAAPNYAITYLPGLLTLNPPPPSGTSAALLTNGGYTTMSNFILSGYFGAVKFSNVATASLGEGSQILLFRVGLPGELNLLQPIAISDYSNATADNDRLVTP